MRIRRLERTQRLPVDVERAFAFFSDAGNLEAITPPWLGFRIITPRPIPMRAGTLIAYRLRLHGVPLNWLTSIQEWVPGRRFVDVQVRGPYTLWHHEHTFARREDASTVMTDRVHYALPAGPVGELAHALFVRRDLAAIFDFRQVAVARLLAR